MDVEREFDRLCRLVGACRTCARMGDSARVLSRSAGDLSAPLMFVGEAPGRLGADGSEIPFHGDKSGHNFEEFLAQVGLDRYSIFVTNAVLCNPKDEKGNNSPPRPAEVKNCAGYLRQQIEIVGPEIIVTLGSVALRALSIIEPHNLTLREHVRTASNWFGRKLIPAYHPGQRAMIHRSFANQLSDYQFISEQLRRLGQVRKVSAGNMRADVYAIVNLITRIRPELSYFALHKLFYLVELKCMEQLGHRLTNAYIIRQKDGPYCTDLHVFKLKKVFPDMSIRDHRGTLTIKRSSSDLFGTDDANRDLPSEANEIIRETLHRYDGIDDSRLKTRVYLTRPMKAILRAEKNQKLNLFNSPINFTAASTG